MGALGEQAREGRLANSSASARSVITATTSMDDILALDADCVVYSPLLPNEDEVVALLRSGKSVVTPVGWVYPDLDNCTAILDACAEGGSTMHGTGIHPGGITERFPLMVSARPLGSRTCARGVRRHPHVQRARRRAPHHGVRRDAPKSRWPDRSSTCWLRASGPRFAHDR